MRTTLVVLAAGIGRRFGGLKQLEPVGPSGETLLEYSVFDALRAGFDHLLLIIRRETESEFKRVLGPRLRGHIELSYAYQEISDIPAGVAILHNRRKPWGTGQAVLAAKASINEPFAVINADDFYGAPAFTAVGEFLRSAHNDSPPTFALAGFRVGPTLSEMGPVSRGLCRVDNDGWLEKIVEVLKLSKHGSGGRFIDSDGIEQCVSGDDLVSMNMWAFLPDFFIELENRFRQFLVQLEGKTDDSQELLLPEDGQGMIDDGTARIRVLRHNGQWCGITFAEDKERVTRFIADMVTRGEYPSMLWQ